MHDFIAIGDTATDVFIHLDDESGVKIVRNEGELPRLSLPFGAKVTYKESITVNGVGNAPNAVVSASKLGLKSAIVACIGDDEPGRATIASLQKAGVDTQFVTVEAGKRTNYSYFLWYQAERTILRRHEQFKYVLPNIGKPKWVYVSSVGSDSPKIYDELADYLEQNREVKLALQPGSKELKMREQLSRLYKRADIYFSNLEEAETVLGIDTLGTEELLKRLQALGPKIVVVTDGPNGAHAYDGNQFYTQVPFPDPKPPVERTGAGDSFSSTTTVALAYGLDLQTALKWGAINSAYVVQEVGGQKGLLTREQIEECLK